MHETTQSAPLSQAALELPRHAEGKDRQRDEPAAPAKHRVHRSAPLRPDEFLSIVAACRRT